MELLHHWFLRALFLGLFIVHIGAEIEFREEPYDKVVAQGQPVYFDCMAADTQNRGTISVQWKHNSTPLSAGGRVTIFPNGTLQLVSTQTGDEGTYSCTASLVVSGGLLEQRESLAAMLYFAFLNPVDLITGNQTVIDKQLAPAYFQCVSGESRPLPTIIWERNGIPVTDELSYGEQFGGTGSLKWSQTLQINNVRKRHEGSYRCVVSNPLLNGQVQRSSYSFLEVLPNPGDPYISIAPRNQIIPAGEPAIFSCQILGDPAPSISWRKLDDPDDLIDTPERYARNDGSLYFADVADMYEGNYVCTGTSRLGQVSTNPVALISARMDWVFTQNPSDTEVVEDDRATLSCRPPFSKPQANITWYKDNAVFQGVAILGVGDVYFSSITKDDEGSYFCVATNDFLPQSVTSDTAVLSVRVKASIEVPPVAREVILGNDLTLTCEARGDPTPMIVWRKDSAIIQAGGRTTIGNAGQLLHILGIIGLDQGTYTCEVSNAYGSESASVYVDVLVSPQITTGPGDLRVGLGSSILLPCIVIGDPVPDVTWYKDNTLLTFDPSDIHYQLTNQGLTINEARVSDGGSFRCQATNKAGTSESSGTLIIETPPVITTPLTNQTVYQEAVVVFVCQASGEPRPDLVWFFNDGPVPSWGSISNQGQILTVSSASDLTIGKVTCRAQNRQGQAESEANLQVRVAPDILPISDSTVDAGTSFTVHCITSAFPEPTITWLKGQDVIIASERIIFSSPGSLTIASVTKEDQGDYSCVASNGVGNTRENFRISVLGLPGAPTILNAAPVTGDSITVYWSVGGDVMDTTHYQLQYKLSLMTSWTTFLDSIEATISPQSSTVYGLDESRSYQFRIYAKNSLGISSPSNIVVASTPSVTGPSAPRNFKILSFNATAVTLQWEIPVTKNGPIEVYTVEYRKTGTNDYSSVQVLGNDQYTIEAIVVGLSPISSYQFRVTAATLHNGQHQFGDFTDYIEQMTSPSAPTASPSNVVITASSSTTILVSWSTVAPEHQNGPIQGYNVSYKETGSSITPWVETVDETVFSVRLTGLMKWTEYDVQMWAFNGEGAGPKTDVIIRRTKADAPTASPLNIGLIATNKTAILVTWQALPEADRFGPIDGYLVTYWSQNSMSRQTLDVPGTDNFLVLTGLEVATLYFAQMVAYNLVDGVRLEGPPSVETSASTQEGIPGHVRSITASEVGSDYIYLSWEPPSNSNGVILAYVITYTADFPQEVTTDVLSVVTGGVRDSSRRRRDVIFGNETYGQIETTETFYNLTSLKPETDYVIEIRGRTSAGMGVNAEKLFISTGRALPTRLPPPGQGTTQPPMDSQPPPLTETMNPFPGEAAYPLNSLIIFISAVSLAGAALCLALVVLLVWCKRRGDDKTLKNSNYLIDNDQMCSSSQRSGSDDIVLDISRANSKSPSTVSSRNTSRLPSVSTPTPSPPEEFADLSGMNDGPMDPNRPRASSSPSMDHMRVHRDMDGYAAYGGQVEQGSGTVPRANGRLYTPARSPRNAKYHPASHGQLESQDTTPDKLDELYNKVARTSRGPSRLKQDSLAAIAVLLDQEETNGDLQPVENPSSIVISNERTTL
ncbi:Down syndrome cell adhesion molecule-like protein 1 homolog [Asterias rubens]|uniref:Down syndrome cell adhesion molecule-like protein 1 homolog n=1 Tax=Asterias rubens TaxID=7604 RepID=UPI00145562E5|nr:Down syndrome cell adhesion molecule-like protein 1 homolog [Asterias rubens]